MKNKIVTVFIKQQSFFISKILYGCVIWINLSIKKMKLVKKVQNNADHLLIQNKIVNILILRKK